MSRFFFNITRGNLNVFDTAGVDLESVKQARCHMIGVATGYMLDHELGVGSKLAMEVLDEGGTIVATMDFGIRPD